METTKKNTLYIRKLAFSGMFLALALVLPFLTGQVPQIGSMLLPMHLPVLLCGFICGWQWGLGVGFLAPLLRFALFGMPPLMPTGIAMAFELATYGCVAGLLYILLKKNTLFIYIDLIVAMLAGRVVWGVVRAVIAGVQSTDFGMAAFWAGAFATALPGIILQLILIPLIIEVLRRNNLMLNK